MSGFVGLLAAGLGAGAAGGSPQGFVVDASGSASCAGSVASNGSANGTGAISDAWYMPLQTGIGAGYWLRCTRLSGNAPTGDSSAGTTWVSISSARTWSLSSVFGAIKACALRVDIASDSAGAAIVATGYIYLSADNGNNL